MSKVFHTIALFFLASIGAGCPADPPRVVDGGHDASEIDDDVSAPADGDRDGVEDARDCDPTDAGIGTTSTRSCTTICGAGSEACSDGVWSACVATMDCTCATDGERRNAPCGNCGQAAEECMSGRWMAVSACTDEGECAVAAVETRAGDRCSEEQRVCGDDCRWGGWALTVPMGECEPGERGTCVSTIPGFPAEDYLCSDACERIDDPCCPPMTPPAPGC